jgi:DNA-binding CsgD family transcriptional regulator
MTCPHCGLEPDDNVRDVEIYRSLGPAHKKTLNLVITGMHPIDIAKVLGIKYVSARGYLHMLFMKTGTENRKSLVLFVIKRPTLLRLVKEMK